MSFQINNNGKRVYQDQNKNNEVTKRLCGYYQTMSPTTPQNVDIRCSGKFRIETKPCNNQKNNLKQFSSLPIRIIYNQNHTTTSPKPLCYSYLEQLCDDQVPPEETSSKLSEKTQLERFEALLQENEIRYDLMKLIIHTIYKVCQSRIPTHLNTILGILNKVRFWSILGKFIVELETRKECLTDPDVSSMLEHICKILSMSLKRIPHLYSCVPLHQLQSAVSCLKEKRNVLIESSVDNLLKEMRMRTCEKRNP